MSNDGFFRILIGVMDWFGICNDLFYVVVVMDRAVCLL